MPQGKLEVLLVGAKRLQNTDCLSSKMDPYCILTCRTQQRKSSVATGQGTSPNWNENFIFTISEGTTELKIKIMDSDMLSADDFVGEASIPLHSVFEAGSVPQTSYNVVKDHKYYGEIRLTLAFKPEGRRDRGLDGDILIADTFLNTQMFQ
ncbi:Elicitor responsive protein 3 [Melia azedarach]|uniref:Elicitor responsive protein 3 n=1 Tax=Melia azedarach TaxID=155640 RepID=A0ACC1XQL2_MELAZ|nr:Elicitor responsive protein 3 [Melia azedarach]